MMTKTRIKKTIFQPFQVSSKQTHSVQLKTIKTEVHNLHMFNRRIQQGSYHKHVRISMEELSPVKNKIFIIFTYSNSMFNVTSKPPQELNSRLTFISIFSLDNLQSYSIWH